MICINLKANSAVNFTACPVNSYALYKYLKDECPRELFATIAERRHTSDTHLDNLLWNPSELLPRRGFLCLK